MLFHPQRLPSFGVTAQSRRTIACSLICTIILEMLAPVPSVMAQSSESSSGSTVSEVQESTSTRESSGDSESKTGSGSVKENSSGALQEEQKSEDSSEKSSEKTLSPFALQSGSLGSLGVRVWNVTQRDGPVTLDVAGPLVAAFSGEKMGEGSMTIEFASGRKTVARVGLHTSDDFRGHLLLTDRAQGLEVIDISPGSSGLDLSSENIGSLTLVVREGKAELTGITQDDMQEENPLALSLTQEKVKELPELLSPLLVMLRSRHESLEQEHAAVVNEKDVLTKDIADLTESIPIAVETLAVMRSELQKSSEQLKHDESRATELQEKISDAEKNLASLREAYDAALPAMEQRIFDGEKALLEAASGAMLYRENVQKAEEGVTQKETLLTQADEKLVALRKLHSDLTALLAEQKALVSELEKLLLQAQATYRTELARRPQNKTALAASKTALADAQKKLTSAKTAVTATQKKIPTSSAIKTAENAVIAAQKELDAAKLVLQKAKEAYAPYEQKIASFEQGLERAKLEKADAEAALQAQEEALQGLREELSALERTLPALREAVKALEENVGTKSQLTEELSLALEAKKVHLLTVKEHLAVLVLLLEHAVFRLEKGLELLPLAEAELDRREANVPGMNEALDELRKNILALAEKAPELSETPELQEKMNALGSLSDVVEGLRLTLAGMQERMERYTALQELQPKFQSAIVEMHQLNTLLTSLHENVRKTLEDEMKSLAKMHDVPEDLLAMTDLPRALEEAKKSLSILEAFFKRETLVPTLTVTAQRSNPSRLLVEYADMPSGVSVAFGNASVLLTEGNGSASLSLYGFRSNTQQSYSVRVLKDNEVVEPNFAMFGVMEGKHVYAERSWDLRIEKPLESLTHERITNLTPEREQEWGKLKKSVEQLESLIRGDETELSILRTFAVEIHAFSLVLQSEETFLRSLSDGSLAALRSDVLFVRAETQVGLDRLQREREQRLSIDYPEWKAVGEIPSGAKGMAVHPGGGNAYGMEIDSSGRMLLLTSSQPASVITANAKTLKRDIGSEVLENIGAIASAAWNEFGTQFALGTYDGRVEVRDALTKEVQHEFRKDYTVAAVAFSPHEPLLFALDHVSLTVFDLPSGRASRTFDLAGYPFGGAFTPDASAAVIAKSNGIELIDLVTGQRKSWEGQSTSAIAIAQDGKSVTVGHADGTLSVLSLQDLSVLSRTTVSTSSIRSLAMDRYGRIGATCESGEIALLETKNEGRELAIVQTFTVNGMPSDIQFSPSGISLLVLSSSVGTGNSRLILFDTPPSESLKAAFGESDVSGEAVKRQLLAYRKIWSDVQVMGQERATADPAVIEEEIVYTLEPLSQDGDDGVLTAESTESLELLAANTPESDSLALLTQEVTKDPTIASELLKDDASLELLAKTTALEVDGQNQQEQGEKLQETYIEVGSLAAEKDAPPMLQELSKTVLAALESVKAEHESELLDVSRQSIRLNAEMQRHSAVSQGEGTVNAEDIVTFEVKDSEDLTVEKKLEHELVNLGGVITVHTLRGTRSSVSLAGEASDGGVMLRSEGQATVLDFTTAESKITDVSLSLSADPALSLTANVVRGAETLETVSLGTGRTLEVKHEEGISGIIIEHPAPMISPEAKALVNFRRNYSPYYLNNDPGPDATFFREHEGLAERRGEIVAEANSWQRSSSIGITRLALKGNIASPNLEEGPMTPLSHREFARLWIPDLTSVVIPRDSMYDSIPGVEGQFTSVRLQRYKNGPTIEDVGIINPRNQFVPLPRELLKNVGDIWVIAPLPKGVHLVMRTSGGISSSRSGDAALGTSYDYDIVVKNGPTLESVLPPEQLTLDMRVDLCSQNTPGDGWFQSVPMNFSCKIPVALGSVKARVLVSNISQEHGAITLSAYSGPPATPESETLRWSGSSGIGSGESRGVWISVPVVTDSEGRGMIKVVATNADGTIVGKTERSIAPTGTLSVADKEANVAAFKQQWAAAMEVARQQTVAYYQEELRVSKAPEAYDWKQFVASTQGQAQAESPLPVEVSERLMRTAVRTLASAKASGDVSRILAADKALSQGLVVYAGSLAYGARSDSQSTPEALLSLVQHEVQREDAREKISVTRSSALTFLDSQNLDISRSQKMLENVSVTVAGVVSDRDLHPGVRWNLSDMKSCSITRDLGSLPLQKPDTIFSDIKFGCPNGEVRYRFEITQPSMVNGWIHAPDNFSFLAEQENYALKLQSNTIVRPDVTSEKPDPTSAESVSQILQPGEYTISVQDLSDYRKLINPISSQEMERPWDPEESRIALHLFVTPLRTQSITGVISVSGGKRAMPVRMSVAEFERDSQGNMKRNNDYTSKPENGGVSPLQTSSPLWIVVHGRGDNENSDAIAELSAALSQKTEQVVTVDWQEPAKDNFPKKAGLQGSRWINDVGAWVGRNLQLLSVRGSDVNLVGHSWGSYVAHSIGSNISGGVNTIVALDPAKDSLLLGSKYKEEDISLSNVSQTSYALHSSHFGDLRIALTSDYQFGIFAPENYEGDGIEELGILALLKGKYPKSIYELVKAELLDEVEDTYREHGFAVTLFSHLLTEGSKNAVSKYFTPQHLSSTSPSFTTRDNSYEGLFYVHPTKSSFTKDGVEGEPWFKANKYNFYGFDSQGELIY